MRLRRVAAPSGLPVSTEAARAWCWVDGGHDDELIEQLIAYAVDRLDGRTGLLGRALEAQSWELLLDAFPEAIALPLGPVVEVVSITYEDAQGERQTLSDDAYRLDRDAVEGFISPVSQWPSSASSVAVTWRAGDGCPPALKMVILQTVKFWYDNREVAELPPGAMRAIAAWRRQAP